MNDREKAKAARRNLIVGATIECFINNGIHQTGVRDIAKHANISLGNLYNHFASKDELIAEIAILDGAGLDVFVEALNSSQDALTGIKKFIGDYLDYVVQTDNSFLTIDIIAESLRNPTIAEQFEINRAKIADALAAMIERGIAADIIRKDINSDETVRLFLDTIEGLGLRCGLANTTPSKTARKTLDEMIFRMLLPS